MLSTAPFVSPDRCHVPLHLKFLGMPTLVTPAEWKCFRSMAEMLRPRGK